MIRSGSGVEAGKCSAGRGRGCSEHCQIPASWQVVSNLEPNRSRKKVRDDRFLYSAFLNIFKVVTNESQKNRPHPVRCFQNIANSGWVMKLEITSVSGFLYASSSYRVRPNSRHHIQALIKPNYRTRGSDRGTWTFRAGRNTERGQATPVPWAGSTCWSDHRAGTWRAAAQSRTHVHLAQTTVSVPHLQLETQQIINSHLYLNNWFVYSQGALVGRQCRLWLAAMTTLQDTSSVERTHSLF